MIKIDTFEEVKLNLKSNEVITLNGKDAFYLKDNKVTHKFNGSSYKIAFEDFVELYKDKTFYLQEDEITVDDKKDEEYYGRIQKSN